MMFSPEARRLIQELHASFRMERTIAHVAYMDEKNPELTNVRRKALRRDLWELHDKKIKLFAALMKELKYES